MRRKRSNDLAGNFRAPSICLKSVMELERNDPDLTAYGEARRKNNQQEMARLAPILKKRYGKRLLPLLSAL